MKEESPPDKIRYDAVYLHSLREAVVIVVMFSIACIWAIGISFASGYQTDAGEEVATVLGLPAWVFYAVLLPWVVIDIAAIWFCFFYMKNDELGEAVETAAYEFGEGELQPHDDADLQNPAEPRA